MNQQQLRELIAAVTKLADSADAITAIIAAHSRTEKNVAMHAAFNKFLNITRDCGTSLRHALNDARARLRRSGISPEVVAEGMAVYFTAEPSRRFEGTTIATNIELVDASDAGRHERATS
jgi:hypothetical protein